MKFSVEYLIRFQHCDPAGIVFYPRYYEMFSQVVEDWFAEALQWDFSTLAANGHGIPLVHTDCEFLRPSQIGDLVTFELAVKKLGETSFTTAITARRGHEVRVQATLVMTYVEIGPPMKKLPIPPDLRRSMEQYLMKG